MSQFIFRAPTEGEYNACDLLIRKAFRSVAEQFSLTKENCPSNQAFWEDGTVQGFAEAADCELTAVLDGETLIGFMRLIPMGEDALDINTLCVLPEYRRRGIGRELIGYARERAEELHLPKVTVGIIEDDVKLKSWYMANGFIPTGIRFSDRLPFVVGFLECKVTR